MKSLLKATVVLLLSAQAMAEVSVSTSEQMNHDIQNLKRSVQHECQSPSIMTQDASAQCKGEIKKIHKMICSKKLEMVAHFEAVMSSKNIAVVAKHFGETPPADALGGVLLWQMKNSVDQVNSTWLRGLGRLNTKTANCVTDEMKKDFADYTNYFKNVFSETKLLVEVK